MTAEIAAAKDSGGGDELAYLSAQEVLDRFTRLELAPSEYLEHLLQRTTDDAATAAPINAFTETLREESRRQARAADEHYAGLRARAGGSEVRRLTGLPVATKEKHGLAGRSLTQGMAACAGEVAPEDHPVVQRIRRHGAVIHARTTSPEFSCATFTHTRMWGVTRNPWDRSLSPGGSSGGASAALAAGLTPLATASDIAGSTRLPAGFTGVVGYKGPYGSVPGAGPFAADWYRGDGAMARTVGDVALLTEVLRGAHASDHASVPTRAVAPGEEPAPADLRGRRIVYSPTLGDYPVQGTVLAQVEAAVQAMEAAGAEVREVSLPWSTSAIRETTMAHFGYILAEGMSAMLAGREDTAEDYTRQFIADARRHAEQLSLFETLERERVMQAQLGQVMAGADVLVTPVSAVLSLPAEARCLEGLHVTDVAHSGNRHVEHYWEAHMTVPFNVANRCPVLSVPAGRADGIPVGLQIVGHPYDEASVFDVAARFEQIRPWRHRRPRLG